MIDLEFLINTLSLGSLYALLALGLVLVYGILKLVNFAYGEYIMVGGYAMYLSATVLRAPWYVMLVLAVLAAVLTSYLTELAAFRPVRAKSASALIVTSFAVSIFLQNIVLILVSPRSRAVQLPFFFSQTVNIAGATTPVRNLLVIAVTAVLLVALSLLFGIFLTKPSPFCLMDEVDAPLDDANVGRFTTLLDEFKKDTQFLVITHNPRTMQSADAVYGVTMQEPGVSTVVGVRLGQTQGVASSE